MALGAGCLKSPPVTSEHERKVLELANRHAEQQSVQRRQMAELQKQWQTERTQLNEQRDRLDAERREIVRHPCPYGTGSVGSERPRRTLRRLPPLRLGRRRA